jgi:ubiquinone/menaquinone biosynthesis C-methylase UbiE
MSTIPLKVDALKVEALNMEMNMATTTSGYLLSDSAAELDRLRVQARFWEADAEALIGHLGVRPGWRCLDVGCGAMGILRVLSRAVGDNGSVVGLDNDSRMLEAAGRWALAQRLTNVDLVAGDAYETSLPRGSFDLVHARFLFCPLGEGETLLREMIDLARPGGWVAVQEPISASWRFYPPCEPVQRLTDAVVAAFRAGGGNFDAGAQTYAMMKDAGLADVQARAVVRALPPGEPYRRLPVLLAMSLRERMLDEHLLSGEELEELVAAAEAAAADENMFATTFTLTQVWGRKPA